MKLKKIRLTLQSFSKLTSRDVLSDISLNLTLGFSLWKQFSSTWNHSTSRNLPQSSQRFSCFSIVYSCSSPEAALLLVSIKNRDLWPCPTTEVRDSRTSRHSAHALSQVWQIWLVLVSIYCVYKSIQNRNVLGPGQRSRFLVLTKRSAGSGDENVVYWKTCFWVCFCASHDIIFITFGYKHDGS